MEKTQLNLTVPVELKQMLQETAERRGVTMTALVSDALDVYARLPEPVYASVKRIANGLRWPLVDVIQALIVDYFARHDGKIAVYGPRPRVLSEFPSTEDGPMRGEELYRHLLAHHINNIERDRERDILTRAARGCPMDAEEKAFLEKRRGAWGGDAALAAEDDDTPAGWVGKEGE